MADLFTDADADLGLIARRNVAVLGFGPQGRAHALSLRDSGVDVRVGLPVGDPLWAEAEAEGLRVAESYEACEEADLVMVAVPDDRIVADYRAAVEPNLVPGDALFFLSAQALGFGWITPPAGVLTALVAPQGPGHLVRREYSEGRGVPVLIACAEQAPEGTRELALAYAKALGGLRAGAIATTMTEAATSAQFGQALAGAAAQLLRRGVDTLTDAGVQPEVAQLATLGELKQLIDQAYARGLAHHLNGLDATAALTCATAGERIVDDHVTASLAAVRDDIAAGGYAERAVADLAAGGAQVAARRTAAEAHPTEATGRSLRGLMAWVKSHDDDHVEGTVSR